MTEAIKPPKTMKFDPSDPNAECSDEQFATEQVIEAVSGMSPQSIAQVFGNSVAMLAASVDHVTSEDLEHVLGAICYLARFSFDKNRSEASRAREAELNKGRH